MRITGCRLQPPADKACGEHKAGGRGEFSDLPGDRFWRGKTTMTADVAALLLTGVVSIIGQTVLLRELNVAFSGVELIYPIALGVWMLLTAAGVLIGGRRPSIGRLALLMLLLAISAPLGLLFLRASHLIFGAIPGACLPCPPQMAALVIALLPMGLLSGYLFREAAEFHAERGLSFIGAFGIESAGALVGGLLATLCFRYGVQNLAVAFACTLIAGASSFFLFPRKGGRLGRMAALALSAVMIVGLYQSPRLDQRMTGWNHPGFLVTRDSPSGRITATVFAGELSVFKNGALALKTGGAEAEIFANLTALQHPEPRRILLFGGGWDGTLRELLRHRPVRIDAVLHDLDPVSPLRRYLPAETRASLADPAVRLSRADPRQFLRQSGFAWDLILVDMTAPASGETNRFYTREFFAQCALRLHPGGVVALRLPAAESLRTSEADNYRMASVYKAFASIFPEILVLPAATTIMTASSAPLPRLPETLTDRLRERGLQSRLVTPTSIRGLFADDRFSAVEKRLQAAAVPANTDIRPAAYPFAVTTWLARCFPTLAPAVLSRFGFLGQGLTAIGWILGIAVPLFFFGSRLRPAWRRTLLAAVAGFLCAVAEAVLLLAYQAKTGLLYQEIGFLSAAFMAGLALGAPLFRDLIAGTGARKKRMRGWGIALLAGFGIIQFAAFGIFTGGFGGGLLLTAVLLAATGLHGGGLFAYACLSGVRGPEKVTAPLSAANWIGGGFGAILGGLALIPLFGFAGTLTGMIALAALALLLP